MGAAINTLRAISEAVSPFVDDDGQLISMLDLVAPDPLVREMLAEVLGLQMNGNEAWSWLLKSKRLRRKFRYTAKFAPQSVFRRKQRTRLRRRKR